MASASRQWPDPRPAGTTRRLRARRPPRHPPGSGRQHHRPVEQPGRARAVGPAIFRGLPGDPRPRHAEPPRRRFRPDCGSLIEQPTLLRIPLLHHRRGPDPFHSSGAARATGERSRRSGYLLRRIPAVHYHAAETETERQAGALYYRWRSDRARYGLVLRVCRIATGRGPTGYHPPRYAVRVCRAVPSTENRAGI